MQYVRTVKEPMPFEEMGWGVVGRKLADAMQGSDMEVYYSLLCATVRRCQADMVRIKPGPPDEEPSQSNAVPTPNDNPSSPLVEKIGDETSPKLDRIADMTHRGTGL
jgi:hypothetical protein